jgi:hypothetical protein
MPTPRPRIAVLLPLDQYEAVRDLAKATRLSMSRVIADVIEPAVPFLIRSTEMLRQSALLTEEAKFSLRRDLDKQEKVLMKAAGSAYHALAETEAAIKRAGGGARSGPRQPARRRRSSPAE